MHNYSAKLVGEYEGTGLTDASPPESEPEMMEAALHYAQCSILIFPAWNPTENGGCACPSPAKHPIGFLAPRGLQDATKDPERVQEWWALYPEANIGMPTGAWSGAVVLDVDPEEGGHESLLALVRRHGVLPETRVVYTGGGGRSTFLAGLGAMLGPRAGLLGLSEIQRNRFALADIPGKTLLTATEQPAGYLRTSHVLKALISGEPIQVEKKYRDPFVLVPRAKIAWAMNELPRVGSASDGLFRRVNVLHFEGIPEEERDPAVKSAIEAEGAGILNRALAGLERLRERGRFEVPRGRARCDRTLAGHQRRPRALHR